MFVRAIFWKELREHRVQALILMVLAVLIIAGLLPLLDSGRPDDTFRVLLSACFAWACGMVTGAILLANESESMTQMFLDVQPRKRMNLWWSKASFGVLLTVFQALFLATLCLILRQQHGSPELPAAIVLMNVLGGLFGLSCGLFGSSLGKTVLAAIGWSVVALFGSSLVMGVFNAGLLILLGTLEERDVKASEAITLLAFIMAMPVPLALSALFYTRLDRERGRRLPSLRRPRFGFSQSRWGVVQTLWLSFKQGWILNLILAAVALVAGPLLIVEPVAVWPVATLLIGLLAGVGVVGDEQFYGSFRFLAEQRLPLGRFWLLKVGSRLLPALVLAAVTLLMGGIVIELAHSTNPRSQSERWMQEEGVDYIQQMGRLTALTVWLVYGFAFGHLAGMLARKTFIAFAVAAVAAGTCLAIWLPSLIGGGLPAWQVFAIPVGLLILARVSVWKWATDRLHTWRSLAVWGACTAFGIGFIGLALGYRVWEVPKALTPFNVAEFESGYPLRVENEVRGKLMRARNTLDVRQNRERLENRADADRTFGDALNVAIEFGWPKSNPDLEQLVEDVSGGEWLMLVKEAAALPPAVVDDPRDLVLSSMVISEGVRNLCRYVAARSLQLQAHGDHAGALDLISAQLAVARHILARSSESPFHIGTGIEASALQVLEIWATRPKVPPALLERALTITRDHEAKRPPFADNIKADYLLQREYIDRYVSPRFSTNSTHRNWKESVAGTALLMPWEKARRERMLNGLAYLSLEAAAMDYPTMLSRYRWIQRPEYLNNNPIALQTYNALPPSKDGADEALKLQLIESMSHDIWFKFVMMFNRGPNALQFLGPCRTRAAQIRLALLLYQHRNQRPAAKLDDLVPDFLPAVPIDPFSEKPFNYRLIDTEEWLAWPKQAPPGSEDWGVEADRFGGAGPMGIGLPAPMGGGPVPPAGAAPPPQQESKPASGRFRPVGKNGEAATHRRVKPGYGVIWSVGPDGQDDGGRINSDTTYISASYGKTMSSRGLDILFVVPRIK
jgi:hypothetical protein